MYKIYINETPLFLLKTKDIDLIDKSQENILVARYMGKPKILLSYIDMLEKGNQYDALYIHFPELKVLYKSFKKLFKWVPAAGGLVFNKEGQILAILRLGFWDLPKGKIDKGEGNKAAAVREVQEETGIQTITLGPLIIKTYHTYRDRKNRRVLKKSNWYFMQTEDTELTPQTEEQIEQAIWKDLDDFIEHSKPIYQNILEVAKAGKENKLNFFQ